MTNTPNIEQIAKGLSRLRKETLFAVSNRAASDGRGQNHRRINCRFARSAHYLMQAGLLSGWKQEQHPIHEPYSYWWEWALTETGQAIRAHLMEQSNDS